MNYWHAQFYDSLLTLEREIEAIWMSKLTWMKFMYLLTRYSAIAEAGVVIARELCDRTYKISET